LLQSALDDVDTCVEYHSRCVQNGSYHILRTLRARSERAAARLFFVSFIVRQPTGDPAHEELAVKHMLPALDDLRAGSGMLDEAKRRAQERDAVEHSHESSAFYASVRRQITNNLAAWYVFGKILVGRNSALADRLILDDDIFSVVRHELTQARGASAAGEQAVGVAADVYAFLWLRDHDEGALKSLNGLRPGARRAALQIDVELVDLYKNEFGSVVATS
jgi:hypothetical protein